MLRPSCRRSLAVLLARWSDDLEATLAKGGTGVRGGKGPKAGKGGTVRKGPKPVDVQKAIRNYLAALPADARKALTAMRAAIRAVAPDAEEVFSYRIPGFKLDGQPLVWYAAFRQHTSLYPMGDAIRRAHADLLEGYETSTGTIRFPLANNQPSAALVRTLVEARIAQIRARR